MAWKSSMEHERRLAERASVNNTSIIRGSIRRLLYPVSGSNISMSFPSYLTLTDLHPST